MTQNSTTSFTARLSSSPLLAWMSGKSAIHVVTLTIVFMTVVSSSFVFAEPAPVDALTIGLFLLLPIVGLTDGKPALAGGFALWLVVAACSGIACFLARDAGVATMHTAVSFYLFGACFLLASFIAKNPLPHTRLFLNAYLVAAVIAAVLGISGYLALFPGAAELFTRYDRATGPFKDPNVYGPFLIAALLTTLHYWLTKPLPAALASLAVSGLLLVGILFSFSRGAWAATAIGLAIYSYVYLITTQRNWDRLKLIGLVVIGAALLALVILIALQNEAIAKLMMQRASLTQSYDVGAEGRFGGQAKAIGLILDNPLGLGAQAFTRFYHHEEVHNVYLSMFLNGGWIGGLVYFMICAGTLALGFRHALLPSPTQPLFLIVYAALAGNIIEGVLIDSDHWRHFYHLMGVTWGLMASDATATSSNVASAPSALARPLREARIVSQAEGGVVIPFDRRNAQP